MFGVRLERNISVFLISVLLPFGVGGAGVAQMLRTSDDAVVTRGDFVRASITVLGIEQVKQGSVPSGRRVPPALFPSVRTANKYHALDVFGKDLGLAKGITRGEAVQVLVKLKELKATSTPQHFHDVQAGSDLEKSVNIAIQESWIQPLRDDFFGADTALKGLDARAILTRVAGDKGGVQQTQSPGGQIQIQYKVKENVQIPKEDVLHTVWQLLNNQYLYQEKINDEEAGYKAAEAIVNTLNDPYTVFLRPANAKDLKDQLGGELTGIGAQVEFRDNVLTVVAPLAGSPAEHAGIKAGDQVLTVDGKSIAGLSLLDAVNKIRGPKGSTVSLHIRRNGTELDINVVRDLIKLPEIDISRQGTVVIIKLAQFGETTDRKLRGLLTEVEQNRPTGIILDLRNNPGGLLSAAETVISNFLPEGSTVAHILSTDKDAVDITSDPPTVDPTIPMVVLVNKGSASASEIVAGALQDAKRATIIGEQTFGKGTVQQILQFKDGSSLKMTIAEWQTPKKRKINGVGVTPDIIITQTDQRDDQLLRALDLLR